MDVKYTEYFLHSRYLQLQYSVQFAYDQFDHRASNSASVYIEAF